MAPEPPATYPNPFYTAQQAGDGQSLPKQSNQYAQQPQQYAPPSYVPQQQQQQQSQQYGTQYAQPQYAQQYTAQPPPQAMFQQQPLYATRLQYGQPVVMVAQPVVVVQEQCYDETDDDLADCCTCLACCCCCAFLCMED